MFFLLVPEMFTTLSTSRKARSHAFVELAFCVFVELNAFRWSDSSSFLKQSSVLSFVRRTIFSIISIDVNPQVINKVLSSNN